ncbi:MAG: helix-turn-helix transcriptional regulator [Erythrobacter sp.]|jgi:transcriptional regulator with XRE-family HTH domain|nr:helix-turn-helix transcriptional regulator [Erythrobacter sp.]
MDESWEEVVDAIEMARMHRGLTQAALAAEVGLSQSQYSRVARLKFVPRDHVRHAMRSWLASANHEGSAKERDILKLLRGIDALRDEVSLRLGRPRRPIHTVKR